MIPDEIARTLPRTEEMQFRQFWITDMQGKPRQVGAQHVRYFSQGYVALYTLPHGAPFDHPEVILSSYQQVQHIFEAP